MATGTSAARRCRHRPASPFNSTRWLQPLPANVDIAAVHLPSRSPLAPVAGPRTILHHRNCSDPENITSPRIGCMGQIKADGKEGSSAPYFGLGTAVLLMRMKIFGRSAKVRDECDLPKAVARGRREKSPAEETKTVAWMDPPLPVLRRAAARREGESSLWMRRCGVALAPLDGLQINPTARPDASVV